MQIGPARQHQGSSYSEVRAWTIEGVPAAPGSVPRFRRIPRRVSFIGLVVAGVLATAILGGLWNLRHCEWPRR